MTNTVSKTVSDETLNCIIQIESGGNPNAKAATSSALGLGQFLNQTWLNTIEKFRPDLLEQRTTNEVLELRRKASISIEMLARFTEDNLLMLGGTATGGDLYLAHFLGAGDAKKLLHAKPDTPVQLLVSHAVIAANRSIMDGKLAFQVRAWAARRMHESMGHEWVAKYYDAPANETPKDDAPAETQVEPPPTAEPEAEDFPDTQHPEAEPIPVPRPRTEPPPVRIERHHEDTEREVPEDFFSWLRRRGKTIAGWISGGGIGLGSLSWATADWRIVAVVVGGIIISSTIIGAFYLASRRSAS